jgi:hypothetical protein
MLNFIKNMFIYCLLETFGLLFSLWILLNQADMQLLRNIIKIIEKVYVVCYKDVM